MKYPWLEPYLSVLTSSWGQQKLPQAIVLTGQQGVGKLTLALSLAEFVLCQNKLDQKQRCGRCRSCELVSAGNHTDLIQLGLQEKSKFIRVEQIRQLSEKLNKTSLAGYQVAVIEPACQMNTAAANALLKTLEEPTGSVLIILVAHNWTSLPATILSRCQRLHVSLDKSSGALDWIQATYPKHDSHLLWKLTQGAPLMVQALLEADYFACRERVLSCLEQSMFAALNPLSRVDEWVKADFQLTVKLLIALISDCVKLSLGSAVSSLINEDEASRLHKMAQFQGAEAWSSLYQRCLEFQRLILSGVAINPQLTLENIMLMWLDFCKQGLGVSLC